MSTAGAASGAAGTGSGGPARWLSRPTLRGRLIEGLLGLLAVQMVIGEVQYRTHLPWWLVLVHVTGAATVWAVELLRRALATHGIQRTPAAIDYRLWAESQTKTPDERPYHRTRTMYY